MKMRLNFNVVGRSSGQSTATRAQLWNFYQPVFHSLILTSRSLFHDFLLARQKMGAYYDEIEIEDMAWDDQKRVYHYPCPCGDRFEISRQQLKEYEDVAICPSCSLIIRVIYDPVSNGVF